MTVDDLSAFRVLPVVTAREVDATVRLARALHAGGMRAIEITLRTPEALAAIAAVRESVPDLLVAAGTVTSAAELEQVVAAGVPLALSPGCTDELLAAAVAAPIEFIPGVATASEVMRVRDAGLRVSKLFPAVPLGGVAILKGLAGPFPDMLFCPTGGLTRDNFRDFLDLPNVVCCGGSWMVSDKLVDNARWQDIERLAAEAMAVS
ncbi:bifunctional 4-hydroxy-2-oxoglutarate aldolase/2-dehydro-3-deoxy-phosphogluconate aldolase [Pseudohalioglobus sediminis]|uniref:2-dehydro-3-deoxy-phosphogluconate aldolase n=1 Tax=Pseudohalioglobus sediminis TaxID=2606449 RepID=A0A5B0X2U3_9GAMM|nr:bifunctional 4-hydroxy-2-oxoglutarate aldolase/2-dehydro-3-deoxy-phosphogluconate aldolase [Pseudohalioglobus sediminis]KAA1192469.1 bifunctional 4-hydroxy-2-oxoglutarate aldolase/2-dehydro-3-deoxy-phosphogluconate aldolase [Pseudohalioglobus sediminis]